MSVSLRIAEIWCTIDGLDHAFEVEVRGRYGAFIGVAPRDTLRIAVTDQTEIDVPRIELAEDRPTIGIERLDDDPDRFRIWREENPFRCELDLAAGTGRLALVNNLYCFDSFLRVLYSLLLPRTDAVLLHSVAVRTNGHAVLAVGRSEAGKTTLGSQGFEDVLCDELPAVRRVSDEAFMAYGTPFWGEFVPGKTNDRAEVGSLFLLRKGPENEVVPTRAADALSEVLSCVLFFGPPEYSARTLDVCSALVERRLRGELHFVPNPSVADFVNNLEVEGDDGSSIES